MSTSTVQRATVTAVLAGAAVLAAAPAYAGPYPHDGTTGPRSPRVVEREATRDLPYSPAPTPAPSAQAPSQPATRTPDRSDPSPVPVTVFGLLGGSLVLGAAGFTVYRYRHHGAAGTATA